MSSLPAFLLAASLAAAPAAFAQAPAPPAAEAIPTGPRAPAPASAPAPPAAAPACSGVVAPAGSPPICEPPPPPPPVASRSVVPEPVAVAPLAAPDAFSTPAHDTGLPATLWRGTSLQVVQAVLPKLAERPLSPAAAALARRVLATGAQGPDGTAQVPAIIADRAAALMAQGDPKGAAAILSRAPGVARDPAVARVGAESALLAGDDARACVIEENLASGRADIYWVRLRAYCQALAGKTAEAQLTFDLANSQAKDAVFTRLMGAKLSGAAPGAPSLRNGLDYALSRSFGLDLTAAKPSPAVAAALSAAAPAEPAYDAESIPPDLAAIAQAIAAPGPFQTIELDRLLDVAEMKDAKLRGHAPAAALIAAAFAQPLGPTFRARMAELAVPEGKAPAGRNLALDAAAADKRVGETALLALWTCADEGPNGLTVADRARIVRALRRAGLEADARAFALEGLAELK
jgi:hypothetical protein